jgi:DNA polymerase III epsilon subunit-like protein
MASETDIFTLPMAFTDLETTGLNPDFHEIIEVGLVVVDQDTLEVLDEWETKVAPQHPERAQPLVRTINGFNEEQWKHAPSLGDAMREYTKRTRGSLLCAWNVRFEAKFLEKAFGANGLDINEVLHYHAFDVIPLAMEHLRGTHLEKFTLSEVARSVGLHPEPSVHRALNGAKKAFEVYKTLRNMR